MRKITLLLAFVFTVISVGFAADITVADADLDGDATWTADNVYHLDGYVFLESGTLTIQPGTVIKGLAEPSNGDAASALIITRDAEINAVGTMDQPIIFTAEIDDVSDNADLTHEDRGLWGGVVVLGYGVIGDETEEANIEGIPVETYGDKTIYGGSDDAHNAGTMKYVSIRHGGAEIAPGDEINGLSVAGVGSETTFEYIEIFANSDDGFEFWGGTVNTKYLVSAFCGDDAFDYDDGWRGMNQFWFAVQGADEAGSAGEHDGAHPDDNERNSNPMIYNATYIGPGADANNDDVALMLRDGTAGTYSQSIFTSFPAKAIEVEDRAASVGTDSRSYWESGDLVVKNNIWYDFASGDEFTAGELIQVTDEAEDADAEYLADSLPKYNNVVTDPMLRAIGRSTDNSLDPRLTAGSPAWETFAEYPDAEFFSKANYKGAFGTENWASSWTALDEYGYFGEEPFGVGENEIVVTDADLEGDANWTADNTYILDGYVFLESGTLTIAPGTVIKAREVPTNGDNASALIITRDATINAVGSVDLPIIFTSEYDDVTDNADLTHEDRGLWGGVVVLGYGVIGDETEEANIEGIPVETYGDKTIYGGSDDAHNAGTMKYVSIRHGGAEIAPGDEINGLSVAGVGSETTFEYIEIFANSDDGFEFWGGTVNTKYLVSAFCGDDAFDYDDGWRGMNQFWFAIQSADEAGSAGEHDGAHPDDNDRFSQPMIYNVTYIGPGVDANNDDVALMLRDGTGGTYANSVFTGFPAKAIEVEDRAADVGTDSYLRLTNGELVVKNNIWYDFGSGDEFTAAEMIQVTEDAENADAKALSDHLTDNNNNVVDPQLGGISRTTDNQLDPRPAGAESPVYTSEKAEEPSDEFFMDVDYLGAFGSENWAMGWTAVDDYNYFGNLTSIGNQSAIASTISLTNYPNPAYGSTTVEYQLTNTEIVNLEIYDLSGKLVSTLISGETKPAGTHTIRISNLESGMYFYRLTVGHETVTNKMMMLK